MGRGGRKCDPDWHRLVIAFNSLKYFIANTKERINMEVRKMANKENRREKKYHTWNTSF